MILNFLCLYFFYVIQLQFLLASDGGDKSFSKQIMCEYRGGFSEYNQKIPSLDFNLIPENCEIILYTRFYIDSLHYVDVDYDTINKLKSLNKPILVVLNRLSSYNDWSSILTEKGNLDDVTALCNFIKESKVDGFLIRGLYPMVNNLINVNISKYLPTYLQQLRSTCCELKIGIALSPYSPFIKNKCIYNFDALNSLVDFYELYLVQMECRPQIYDGVVPLKLREHGDDYIFSMEEASKIAKDSNMDYNKVVFTIDVYPHNTEFDNFTSYNEVCKGNIPKYICKWCIQSTKDFYDKAEFVKKENSGLLYTYIDLDDINNACECGSFIGFQNVVAGYTGGQQIPCNKFDISPTNSCQYND